MKESVLPKREYSPLNKGKHFPKRTPGVVFLDKGKIATGSRLSHVVYRKTGAVSQEGSWFNFPPLIPSQNTVAIQGQDKTWWDLTWNRSEEPFLGLTFSGVGLGRLMVPSAAWTPPAAPGSAVVTTAAAWGLRGLTGLCSSLTLAFLFSQNSVLGLPVLSFSTKAGKLHLRGMGKGPPVAERG